MQRTSLWTHSPMCLNGEAMVFPWSAGVQTGRLFLPKTGQIHQTNDLEHPGGQTKWSGLLSSLLQTLKPSLTAKLRLFSIPIYGNPVHHQGIFLRKGFVLSQFRCRMGESLCYSSVRHCPQDRERSRLTTCKLLADFQ